MEKTIAGYKEKVKIGIQGKEYILNATLDTGNGGIVPTLGVDEFFLSTNENIIHTIFKNSTFIFEKNGQASPLVGNKYQYRPIVIIDFLEIGKNRIDNIKFALSDKRKNYSTQVLLNRDILSKMNFIIDPSKEYILKNT